MFDFRKISRTLFFLNTRFEIRPFTLLPTIDILFERQQRKIVIGKCEVFKVMNNPILATGFLMFLGGIERNQRNEMG